MRFPGGCGTLRWERHTEFSTWFWDAPPREMFGGRGACPSLRQQLFGPGSLISGIRLEIRHDDDAARAAIAQFEPQSLCHSIVKDGQAEIFTDFRQNGDGLTQILVIDKGMTQAGTGALVQRVLDLETYRTLAMLGLPLAQTLSPEIRRCEDGLTGLTHDMRTEARSKATGCWRK